MLNGRRTAPSLVWLMLLVVPFAVQQSSAKKKVVSQTDLPRFSYAISGLPSDLVQADDATFNLFADKVRSDLESVLRDYEIDDKATQRTCWEPGSTYRNWPATTRAACKRSKRCVPWRKNLPPS